MDLDATAKTLLTGYACCAKNIGIDILNDDCSIDTQTYHAVKKEERIRQAARIKPGWNASRWDICASTEIIVPILTLLRQPPSCAPPR